MEVVNSTKTLFILSGQSNMAGRGGVAQKRWDGVVPPECASDAQKIYRLAANLCWEVAQESLHHDIDTKKACGVGPGMPFANAVKERVGTIGLVPCAVGGTAIREWARGEHLYEDMVKRAKAAVSGGDGSEIAALLWYQGESDTTSQEEVDAYKHKMEELINNVRADLNLPNLPVVQVAIASGIEKKYVDEIRAIQLGMDLPNVICVDAKGLELKEDNLHLTTESQIQLGHSLALAFLANFWTEKAHV
ncbi:probable carbohydrate esterase At4g34215 [Salvia hispanica]|uniref:probable carbohydrate esterase At4g34215 n=1 Tax=Salvia hispanica TaxID=49212 RepID=UPI002008EF43|nr:probable carbohydrate esterase At4g34215 [Salvia hispanica]